MTDKPHKPSPHPQDAVSIKSPSARQVAKELDRRQRRRKIFLLLLLAGAIALAIIYGTCGHGWGLGKGKGKGDGEGQGPGSGKALVEAPVVDAGPVRCEIFIASEGITVDDKKMTRDEAVAACKAAGAEAHVTVAGDVIQKDYDALEQALTSGGVAWKIIPPLSNTGSGSSGSGSSGSSGSAATGSAATGSAATGSAATGSAATGSASVGSDGSGAGPGSTGSATP